MSTLRVARAGVRVGRPGSKNGVRLVEGSGARGRLEVSSTDGWLTNHEEGAVAWQPVCSTGFSDSIAQARQGGRVVCEMLGYAVGRKHYTTAVAFQAPNDTTTPVEYLDCSISSSPPSQSGQLEGGRRRLQAPLMGTVNTPEGSPYTCKFRKGKCDYTGPMAGVECSNDEFPPAPPPPPTPPSPPDRPPSFDHDIQQFGGNGRDYGLDLNLCETSEDPGCVDLARGELLVADPANPSSKVWAPICAPPDLDLATTVADLACKQPAAGAEGAFRPSSYTAWATVTGGDANGKVAVQQLDLQTRAYTGQHLG
ncbi:hypothetical protein TSOC_002460 [Tetrabaena socialis]|uniref:SRCR domain-containing protein n=1 Tax=Tetrabaena socialis TaxID=47790 RepID=A0A2J8AE17_9CHLO|nr:hypothetical protein TSOC_002460 [Tetrabaena socialis]|eukprot:PNH10749.1 hypothetical protein TSOC_002460 [Tetrabaena socialis]